MEKLDSRNMIFEIGKYYQHASGQKISIIGCVTSTMYGKCLVAEQGARADFLPISYQEWATEGWTEITKDEWMKCFSDD